MTVEDRWLLSRLASVTEEATAAIESFRFADAAKALYDFGWDSFCSFYVEMCKPRLADPAARPVAQSGRQSALRRQNISNATSLITRF